MTWWVFVCYCYDVLYYFAVGVIVEKNCIFATGSVGLSTLKILAAHKNRYNVIALTAYKIIKIS